VVRWIDQTESRIAIMTSTIAPQAKPRIDFAEFSIATVAGLALAFTTMFLCVVPLAGKIAASRDFVCFGPPASNWFTTAILTMRPQ